MGTLKANCKQEEVLPIANQVWTVFNADKAAFMAFSPEYNEVFFTSVETDIKRIEKMALPKVAKGEGKGLTKEVYSLGDELRKALNPLESYVKKAEKALTAAPSDFGFKEIRDAISTHNKEGIVNYGTVLLQLIDKNYEPIKAKGFTPEAKAKLENLIEQIKLQSLEKDIHAGKVSKTASTYNQELNALYEKIAMICDDGKIIFQESHPEKVPDYTIAHLLKQVRVKRTKKEDGNGTSEKK